MTDRYAELREAASDPYWHFSDTIRALLADYDRMRNALEAIGTYPLARGQEMSAESMREIAPAALAQEQGESDGV